jgi:acylphosphatase
MKIAHVFISGFVQGIGFRQFIRNNALGLGVSGWVRNLPDGRVEAVLQGGKEDIQKLIQLSRKGPFLAEVENVEVRWEKVNEKLEGFEIIM